MKLISRYENDRVKELALEKRLPTQAIRIIVASNGVTPDKAARILEYQKNKVRCERFDF